jgi:hypothetical protein
MLAVTAVNDKATIASATITSSKVNPLLLPLRII